MTCPSDLRTNSQLSWHQMLAKAVVASVEGPIDSDFIWIASDYSGANDTAQTFSFLVADGERSGPWLKARTEYRSRVEDEVKYTRIGNFPDDKHQEFIRIADELPGYLVTIHAPLDVVYNLCSREEIGEFQKQGKLEGAWTPALVGRAAIIAALASTLCFCLTRSTALLRWVSDNDPIIDTPEREHDVARLFKAGSPPDRKKQFDELDFWKTKEDDEQKFLKDLASLTDLASGAMHECSVRKHEDVSKWGRYSLVTSWLSASASSLVKLNFRFDIAEDESVCLESMNFNSPS